MRFYLLILFLLIGCSPQPQPTHNLPKKVKCIRVLNATLHNQWIGKIIPHTEVPLSFKVTGQLLSMNAQIGKTIRAGELIATVDAQDSQNQLNSLKADLKKADTTTQLMKNNLKRIQKLQNTGAISSSELDQAQANYQSAQAQQQSVLANLATAQNTINDHYLIAPSTGILTHRYVDVGQIITAGQTIITLAVANQKDIVLQIPSTNQIHWKNITVQLLDFPHISAHAVLREITPQADAQTGTQQVYLTLLNPPKEFTFGATVQVNLNDSIQLINIPISALTQKNQQPAVFVVDAHNQLKLQPIVIDHYNQNEMYIRTGLSLNDRVVIAGVNRLFSGQTVSVIGSENDI